ncbi:general secretion pathway protein GspI [Pseudomonas agarici]|uniref:General secretion pathway protein GspI n=1 Tax=Pseudomonas agarici TaxID=46677 RepID=A0A0X1T1Y8_PSEAA|nr:type II secretion system protein [Pseudomonas agarici]AMB86063.1 general secretion pathway protein GspI [Pseudomonas agarici]NWB92256.1 type II secretion system protein [Pseudomonas agarici]NWC07502.1 type II secretion system protein [Pseudomonas agarici]SEK42271.1 general secretion pathway protein I [Pseudomonas agarici]
MKTSTQSGFTLLEMLAAVVLLSIGFAIYLNAMGTTSQALLRDEQSTRMALLARSLFDDRGHGPLKPGHWQGNLAQVQWQLTATAQPATPPVDLYRLELVLEQGTRQERFVTWRAQGRIVRVQP